MSAEQVLPVILGFIVGACITYALFSLLSIWLTWWLALAATFVVQPVLVGGVERITNGGVTRGLEAAASGLLSAGRGLRGLFAKA